ncbi:hypothetical protein ITI46_23555 [Streptomyces oryzae]|uniref:ANTAR domain-containing protein n=1 Tax=Streptomyces oryzae TaxID=1434886 RepID=A0ABS3XGU6_9ACTN|nr:hypothetical protein [Streptomyces oryzae]MBO8194606.1 hypothetical protein [Streptomyces oryzae]
MCAARYRHVRDRALDVHMSQRVRELREKVRAAVRELTTATRAHAAAPTVELIAQHTGLPRDEVRTGLEATKNCCTMGRHRAAEPGHRSARPHATGRVPAA